MLHNWFVAIDSRHSDVYYFGNPTRNIEGNWGAKSQYATPVPFTYNPDSCKPKTRVASFTNVLMFCSMYNWPLICCGPSYEKDLIPEKNSMVSRKFDRF